MIRVIKNESMGRSNLGWLRSIFHFSFAEYQNAQNMRFGVLRVLNDDLIDSGEGFDMHHHRDMEIITYMVAGELTHEDSMGHKSTIKRGQVQYMSAGTGIDHSENNFGEKTVRSLQIWILQDKKGIEPNYGDSKFDWDIRKNKWFHMVSGKNGNAPVKINQDANIFSLELDANGQIEFDVREGRQAYLVQIEGNSNINGIALSEKDAMEIVEEKINIKANDKSHFILLEMKKD